MLAIGQRPPVLLACAGLCGLFGSTCTRASEWTLAGESSSVGFTGTQQGDRFRGSFESFDADVDFDPGNPEDGRIVGVVATGSVDSGDYERDSTLVEREWFDIDRYPEARFQSERIEPLVDGSYRAYGHLTLKGETQPVVMRFTFDTPNASSAHLSGSMDLKRLDFGVGLGMWVDTSWVANEVMVEIELALQR